jgi:hypothetical protein
MSWQEHAGGSKTEGRSLCLLWQSSGCGDLEAMCALALLSSQGEVCRDLALDRPVLPIWLPAGPSAQLGGCALELSAMGGDVVRDIVLKGENGTSTFFLLPYAGSNDYYQQLVFSNSADPIMNATINGQALQATDLRRC